MLKKATSLKTTYNLLLPSQRLLPQRAASIHLLQKVSYQRVAHQFIFMNMRNFSHSPAFLAITNDAKQRIKEVTIPDAKQRLTSNKGAALLDVREESEWNAGRIKGAVHLGKGVLERDIETKFPDKNQELIMYCGGGFRSALTCDAAQKMGYTNVWSLVGGYKALVQAGWEVTK
ncbi:hypothetical protein FGO68_gene6642 [Halteria grandinella]|uniref:Rhodanese domain-containing protein n=1 Tax=Halteria grandinella TaxID=5974 RepID=A0A8J8SWG5_HALGN|nr:hypothetical protein FGO68_gene6642 [Halteria grandinella]